MENYYRTNIKHYFLFIFRNGEGMLFEEKKRLKVNWVGILTEIITSQILFILYYYK